ncbi:hypothetical protein ACFQH8_01625 [Halomicroarcula sp. GCM10025710]
MIFAVPFVLAVGVLIHGRTEAWGPAVAFAVGYVCHPFVDASLFLLQGTVAKDFLEVSFVVWPLTIPGPAIVSALTGVPGLSDLIAIKPVWTARHLPTAPVIGWWIRAAEAVLHCWRRLSGGRTAFRAWRSFPTVGSGYSSETASNGGDLVGR